MILRHVSTYTGTKTISSNSSNNQVTISCSNAISGTGWQTPTISVTFAKYARGMPTQGATLRGTLQAVVNSGAVVTIHTFTANANFDATDVTVSISNSNTTISSIKFIASSSGTGTAFFTIKKIVITEPHSNVTVTAGNPITNTDMTNAGLPNGNLTAKGTEIKISNAMGGISISGLTANGEAKASEWNNAIATNNISGAF